MPLSKKAKIRRQQGKLKRQSARRDLNNAGVNRRQDSGGGVSFSATDLSMPPILTRNKGTRNLLSGRHEARRARADATADIIGQANKPASIKKSKAFRDLNSPSVNKQGGENASSTVRTKRDFVTGRTLFPVESGGKTQYFPLASKATPQERKRGAFVDDASVKMDAVNMLIPVADSVHDVIGQRTLFATENADGKKEYLPKESDATALELSRGKYIADTDVEAPSVGNTILDNKKLRYDFTQQRNLFATQATDGSTVYLPQKSKATAVELKKGQYVDDSEISAKLNLEPKDSMSNEKPRFDFSKRRKIFAVKNKDGDTIYLPRESDASELELARGLFIEDHIVDQHEQKRLRTALKNDSAEHALRRAQRADILSGGVNSKNLAAQPEPVSISTDGTRLWNGYSTPEVSHAKEQETLKELRPKYDLGRGRMLYLTETAKGKVDYLPLQEDASNNERIRGLYATFVPPEPLSTFLENQQDLNQESFETNLGEVKAYTQEEIDIAFENAPKLVLRSANLVSEVARQTPQLQQQFIDTD